MELNVPGSDKAQGRRRNRAKQLTEVRVRSRRDHYTLSSVPAFCDIAAPPMPGSVGRKTGMTQISTDEIAKRAYQLWEAEGCPQGRDVDYWLRAEAELSATPAPDGPSGAAPTTAAPSAPKKP